LVAAEVDDLGIVDVVEGVTYLELCLGQQEKRKQSKHQMFIKPHLP
jgi:hypothetical protein